jgi:hypothetical protein
MGVSQMKGRIMFKEEVTAALHSGAEHGALWKIVGRHRNQYADMRSIYDMLHEVWQEHGYDDGDGSPDPMRDELEYVMEKTWYGHPVSEEAEPLIAG